MAHVDRTTLKTYFNTGDKPTETQFANLIDSNINTTDGGTIQAACDVDFAGLGTLKGNLKRIIRQTDATIGWNDGAIELTYGMSGALILLDKDEATTVTLPQVTAAAIGTSFTFLETVASNNLRSIVTKFDNDYFVGGVASLPVADEDGAHVFTSTGGTDTTIKFDDDLQNGAGGLGAIVTVTAILTGNTGAGGGAKLCWAVDGVMPTADPNGDGTAIFG